MSRCRTGSRNTLRLRNRNLNEKLARSHPRQVGPARCPNALSEALEELTLVMRLHRRWIKEMPEYFEPATVARRRQEQERERWLDEVVRPALDRVYAGPPPT